LKDPVKNSVEEALSAMRDAEAYRLVNANLYARDEERKGYRTGHYNRTFTTTAREVSLKGSFQEPFHLSEFLRCRLDF